MKYHKNLKSSNTYINKLLKEHYRVPYSFSYHVPGEQVELETACSYETLNEPGPKIHFKIKK